MDIEGEIKSGEEANIVKIVAKNLIAKYPDNASLLKEAKALLKTCAHVPEETI